MNRLQKTFAGGAGVGAALVYYFDSHLGNRRRAVARDKLVHWLRLGQQSLRKTASDLRGRSRGWVAGTRGLIHREERVSDEVLVQRVRSKMGRYVSHPHAVHVEAHGGVVTLHGPVITDEAGRLLSHLRRVRGVQHVVDELEWHDEPGNEPGLQGGGRRPGEKPAFLKQNWSPTFRLLAGTAGAWMAVLGLRSRSLTAKSLGIFGTGLLARSLTNMEVKRIVGVGAGRRAIDIQKDIHIEAPVERVFSFWSNYGNFPKFMPHVLEVHDLGNGRSRWKVRALDGIPMIWDAEISSYKPNEILAWRSAEGSIVGHTGIIRFLPDRGGTLVDVKLSYNPPAGAMGDAMVHLLGQDPKRKLDQDLMQVKSLIERGEEFAQGPTISVRETVAAR